MEKVDLKETLYLEHSHKTFSYMPRKLMMRFSLADVQFMCVRVHNRVMLLRGLLEFALSDSVASLLLVQRLWVRFAGLLRV